MQIQFRNHEKDCFILKYLPFKKAHENSAETAMCFRKWRIWKFKEELAVCTRDLYLLLRLNTIGKYTESIRVKNRSTIAMA